MPYKIGVVAPYPELSQLCHEISTGFSDIIMIYEGIFNSGVQQALKAQRWGAEVIISRGALRPPFENMWKYPWLMF